jgi:hypothetical protein
VEECVALMGMGVDDALWIQRIIPKCYKIMLFINCCLHLRDLELVSKRI